MIRLVLGGSEREEKEKGKYKKIHISKFCFFIFFIWLGERKRESRGTRVTFYTPSCDLTCDQN